MPAIKPERKTRRQQRRKPARKALQPRGPGRLGDALSNRRIIQPGQARGTQGRDGNAGIIRLMRSYQPRRRQAQRAGGIAVVQTLGRCLIKPILPAPEQRCAAFGCRGADDFQRCRCLRTRGARHAAAHDPGFLPRDLAERIAQKIHVIHGNGGNGGCRRARHDIRRIQPSAQPHFQHQQISRHTAEQHKGRRRGYLKHRDRRARIHRFHFFQRRGQRLIRHVVSRQPDAFVKMHQMGRGIDMHALPRRFADGAQKSAGRTLAIRPRHMNDRRQAPFRMAELCQQSLHPAQAQINKLGVERVQTLHNRFSAGQGNYSAGAAASASSSLRSSRGCRSREMTRAKVSRISPRFTTMSRMPCSSRYSAR